MTLKSRISAILAAIGMGILILDSKTALKGAAEGIELCIRVILPSLFPFLFLSASFVRQDFSLEAPFLRKLTGQFGFSGNMQSVLIPAFLGGYPAGAQCVHVLYQNRQLSRRQAEHALAYSSNAGPAFLFGILANSFSHKKTLFILWLIQIIAIWTAAKCFSINDDTASALQKQPSQVGPLEASITALAKICATIILFRMLLTFLDRWFLWMVDTRWKPMVVGLLELSNGCCMLPFLGDERLRFITAAVLLSLGGACVFFQTASVCDGLSLKYYIFGKLIQAGTAGFLAALYISGYWYGMLIWVAALACLFSLRIKNKSSNPAPSVV